MIHQLRIDNFASQTARLVYNIALVNRLKKDKRMMVPKISENGLCSSRLARIIVAKFGVSMVDGLAILQMVATKASRS
ncbi:MAG: hypothetical protein ACI9WC_003824 [Arenicella sp.]